METHRLRGAEIIRMAQNGNAGALAIHGAAQITPATPGRIAFDAVSFAFTGQEVRFVFPIPSPIAAKPQAAVMILGKLERVGGGALLSGNQVENPKRLAVRLAVNTDFPGRGKFGFAPEWFVPVLVLSRAWFLCSPDQRVFS